MARTWHSDTRRSVFQLIKFLNSLSLDRIGWHKFREASKHQSPQKPLGSAGHQRKHNLSCSCVSSASSSCIPAGAAAPVSTPLRKLWNSRSEKLSQNNCAKILNLASFTFSFLPFIPLIAFLIRKIGYGDMRQGGFLHVKYTLLKYLLTSINPCLLPAGQGGKIRTATKQLQP